MEYRDPHIADQIRPFQRIGLWIACALLLAGLATWFAGNATGTRLIFAGLGLLVSLPVVNVVVALVDEVRLRQWRFVLAASLVIVILIANVLLKG